MRRDFSTMTSQAPTTTPTHINEDNGSPEIMPPTAGLARHDTSSSTGSAARPPHGNWAINISGVCPSCHHHHRSLQVHFRVSEDAHQLGDVYCNKCRRLWLAFGSANATRLSLLSTLSIEPDPIENAFHSTLIHMIRSTTAIAALSPTLTAIPEAASVSPSRETSVHSTAGRSARRPATNTLNETVETSVDNAIVGHKYSKHPLANGRRMLSIVKQKATAGFFKTRNISFGLRRLFKRDESVERRSHQQDPASTSTDTPPITATSAPPFREHTEAQEEIIADFDPDALDVSASSINAVEALASLKRLNPQALQSLPPQEQISWARRQLTDFRVRHSSITAYLTTHNTEHGEGLHDRLGSPPRRHSVLDFVGSGFDPYEDWSMDSEGYRRANGRPWSISETHTSDADTLVDEWSISSSPRHIFFETLHRNHRRSLSPRPVSVRSVVQDWSQVHRNRAEARRSIDSTLTGANVRSITTTRTHAPNRLSRSSMYRTPSVYGTEPPTSRAQLRLDEETEEEDASQRPRESSPSPTMPETDATHPPE